jgi:hypothetical protein
MDGEQQVAELVWLDPKQLRFFKEKGILRLTIGEERSYWKVQVYRCFPLTDPEPIHQRQGRHEPRNRLALRFVGTISESREVVKEELERRYLVPVIVRIERERANGDVALGS